MVSVLIFTSIDFRNLSHTHKPLTRITALSSLHCAETTHTDAPRSRSRRDRNCADRCRSRSRSRRSASIVISRSTLRAIAIAIIEISEIAIAISPISREASIDASRNRDLADRDRADRDRDRSDRDLTEKLICPSEFYLRF